MSGELLEALEEILTKKMNEARERYHADCISRALAVLVSRAGGTLTMTSEELDAVEGMMEMKAEKDGEILTFRITTVNPDSDKSIH